MGRKERAADAATTAVLRGLARRPGIERAVLAELTPREQEQAFTAEARHLDRQQ